MRYTETTTIRCYQTMPIGEFLATNQLVKQQAAEYGLAPLDWLAGQFLPDVRQAEGLGDWIIRQTGAVLESALLHDTMSGTSHVAKKVSGAILSREDRDWLIRALIRHPTVMGVCRVMLQEAIAA